MVEPGATVAVDVVLGSGKLVLRGKRSEEATDFDNGIRWDVTNAAGETVTTYGGEVTLDLAAGDYTVKASARRGDGGGQGLGPRRQDGRDSSWWSRPAGSSPMPTSPRAARW